MKISFQIATYGLLSILLNFNAFSQESFEIKGQLSDETNESLPGVTVQVQGTQNGVITDIDGYFRLMVKKNDVLSFTMVGMETQTFTVVNQQDVILTMKESATVLGEVVVTGFQEVNRKLFTGASDNLSMKDVRLAGASDISRMLEGQSAGVSVDNVSGTFGSSPKIRIRGNASINGSNQPLFVVDGVILEDLSFVNTDDLVSGNANTLTSSSIANLNPDDIASYQILKDASATAIYGARAANGVIVITTKRGKSGALKVSYNTNFSIRLRPTYQQFDLLNSAEEVSVYRELAEKGVLDITTAVKAQNFGAIGKMYSQIADHQLDWGPNGSLNEEFLNQYENANTDWFEELYKEYALQVQHSLSFTSGSEKSNSYYSLSYLSDEGQTIADNVQRITATSRNTYYLSDKFTFGLKLTASYRDQRVPGTRNRDFDPITGRYSRDFDINPFSYSLNTARSIRPFDEEGNLEYFRRNYAPFNILEELELNYMDINIIDVSGQTDFEFRPREDLVLKGVFQTRYASTNQDHTVHERSNQAEAYRANGTQFIQDANNLLYSDPDNPGLNPVVVLPQGGFNYLDQKNILNFFGRISGEWSKTLNQHHEINVLAGQEIRFTNREESTSTAMGVIYESGGVVVTDPNIIEFFNLQNIDYNTFGQTKDRFLGTFVNGGYAYKGKYIGNFTVRYDGSNQLGRSQKARFLPSWNVSGAWNVTSEDFIDYPFLNELKLRATYGVSGNLPPSASALLNLRSDVSIRPTDVEPYLYIVDLTNENLTWEKLKEFNIGVDYAIFDNKFSGSFNWYTRLGYDLIGTVQTSGIGGQVLKFGNFADMEIQGVEMFLTSQTLSRGNLKWTTSLNVGYTVDQITKLDYGPLLAEAITANGAPVLGGPRRGLFSTKFAGLDSQGIPTFYDETGQIVKQYDLQSRDNLTSLLKYEGPSEPRGSGGFSNTLSYGNLQFTMLFSFKFDYKIRLNDAFYGSYTDFDALPGDLVNRWAVPGDEAITNIPVILDQGAALADPDSNLAYSFYNKSTERVADGGYLRLRSIRVGYNVPQPIVSKIGVNSATVSIEGQNIALLISDPKLNGVDPEFFNTGGVSLPSPKMITFSLNVQF